MRLHCIVCTRQLAAVGASNFKLQLEHLWCCQTQSCTMPKGVLGGVILMPAMYASTFSGLLNIHRMP